MIWGNPQAFWLLLLVPVLIALFMHRRRTVSVTVPSLLFWQAYGRPADGPPLGIPLRKLLNLLAQVVLLCLLVVTLANPHLPSRQKEHLVLIVDTSATMQTMLPNGSSRLQEAVTRAEKLVSSIPDDTLITVVRAAAFPHVLLKATLDKAAVRAALAGLGPTDVDSDLHEAVRLAESLQISGWRTWIAGISDYVGVASLQINNNAVRLSMEQVGTDSPNCGIVGLVLADDRTGLDVSIGQYGLTGQRATLTLTAGQQQVVRQSVDLLQPLTTVRLAATLPPRTIFSVHLEPTDALALDNVAWGVWPNTRRLQIRLVTQGNPYLEQAIAAEPSASLQVVTPDKWDPASSADVTVLDGADSAAVQQAAGNLIVFAGRPIGPATADSTSAMLSATDWAADHPVLRSVDPSLWRVRRAAGSAVAGARILVSAQGVPLVYESTHVDASQGPDSRKRARVKVIVFNFSLGDSDLALRPAFPVVLWDAIDYLSGTTRMEQSVARRTGSALKVPVLLDAPNSPAVAGPDSLSHSMLKQGSEWVWLDTSMQGVYVVRQTDTEAAAAFNWMSLRTLVPYKPLQASETTRPPEARASWMSSIALPWQMLLALATAAAILEWVLFQRRILDMRQE
jgi:hypothetical protein